MQQRKGARVRSTLSWSVLVALPLLAVGCGPEGTSSFAANQAHRSEPPQASGFRTVAAADGVPYAEEQAVKSLATWTPLELTGELQRYDPASDSFEFDDLLQAACDANSVWKVAEAFEEVMMEMPVAIRTPDGPVLYSQVWDKGTVGRTTFVGVRLSDKSCGAFDRTSSQIVVAGDADILSLLIAAAAIREVDGEADRRTLTMKNRWEAEFLIPTVLRKDSAPAAEGRADTTMQTAAAAASSDRIDGGSVGPAPFTKEEVRRLSRGKTKAEIRAMFGPPARVGEHSEGQDYWAYDRSLGGRRVYDAEAGVPISKVLLIFAGDAVSVVSF